MWVSGFTRAPAVLRRRRGATFGDAPAVEGGEGAASAVLACELLDRISELEARL